MKNSRVTSAEEYKLSSSFEAIRRTLLQSQYADRREKPLAFWALPNDRRLPLAFLGRTVADLLDTPYEVLAATPGIGQKKISSLVTLLHRATKDKSPATPYGIANLTDDTTKANGKSAKKGSEPESESNFDATVVSEALWDQWKKTVRRHKLDHEKLGRLAPTLRSLPTVIWHTPMSEYLDYTVAEIRQFKTHGEKRVRVVLEVFYVVHEILQHVNAHPTLDVSLTPQFVAPIRRWLNAALEASTFPTEQEVRQHLALPLLEQIKLDVNETVHQLAEARIGIRGQAQSVRMQSRQMGVTRARIYQLLDDCNKVIEVRWPEGRRLLTELDEKITADSATPAQRRLLDATRELFFPEKIANLDADSLS